ncbi:MAG: ATP-dependent DNA ligase [Candidatus Nanoarchaeia archaeon]|nr:ATP-dependent DNA ligase [Candidatus Jingweiarchaeum tengchongense]
MKFSKLADYFEKLESTTKRLEMFEILSNMFKEAEIDEIDKLVYFSQERLLPPFKGVEIGMAEKLVERAIAKVCNVGIGKVESLYKKMGDLGLVAESMFKGRSGSKLDVTVVYNELMKIAKTSGPGSIELKINYLAGILSKCSPKEAKYIVRFVSGRLRLGIGDPTILDSLSKAKVGDRSLREELERAYNLCSDLGLVAQTLFKEGIKGIKEFKVTVGNPIRMALAERLPSAEEIIKKVGGKCSVEAKYDGFRAQLHKKGDEIEIFSRNLERTTHMFPEIVKAAKEQIRAKDAILEGEALAYNEETGELFPFQVTIQRKRKHGIKELAEEYPLRMFVFDLLYVDGVDYTKKSYEERRKALERIVKDGDVIKIAERIVSDDPKEIMRYFDELVARGLEGIMCKKLDSPYQAGARNFNWIKLKRSYKGELADTIDVVLVGYFKGRGARAKFGIGALLGAVYDDKLDVFKTVAKIGSGLSEERWVEIRKLLDETKVPNKPARVDSLIEPDVWVEPNYVITVKADEITRSPVHTCGRKGDEPGFALRFPRMTGWIREDKKPEDATTEKEIMEMFKMQKHVNLQT